MARLLYLIYGSQSGVVPSLTAQLEQRGLTVAQQDVLDGFLFKRRIGGLQVPNATPEVVGAVLAAARLHGSAWKDYYLQTPYAFGRMSRRADRAIARQRPDIVLQSGALFAPAATAGVPFYLFLDNTRAIAERYPLVGGMPPPLPHDPDYAARERAVYQRASGIFVMSRFVAASLVADYGVAPERVHVVGAGPNVEPGPEPLRPGREREPAFLFVGAGFAGKGGPTLLEAFASVRSRHPQAELWVVGGHQGASQEGVRYLGFLPRAEVAPLYRRAFAFVLPTVREAFGLAFLEAMAFGLPCIGTRAYAIPEIVLDGRTGLLVAPADAPALARAMAALFEDRARAEEMGTEGRRHLDREFGWARCADRVTAVFAGSPPATSVPH